MNFENYQNVKKAIILFTELHRVIKIDYWCTLFYWNNIFFKNRIVLTNSNFMSLAVFSMVNQGYCRFTSFTKWFFKLLILNFFLYHIRHSSQPFKLKHRKNKTFMTFKMWIILEKECAFRFQIKKQE